MLPRLRSISMNAYIRKSGAWRFFRANLVSPVLRLQQNLRHHPADAPGLFVFVDEHPDSINNGWLIIDPETPNEWGDNLPDSYHNRACGFQFADGHSEIHKWVRAERASQSPSRSMASIPGTSPVDRDIQWATNHCTAPLATGPAHR